MGTEKRARQKANRALKQQQEAQAARTDKVKRSALKWAIVIAVAFAAALAIAWAGGAFGGGSDDAAVETTVPSDLTNPPPAAGYEGCPAADGSAPQVREYAAYPDMCIDTAKTYTAEIVTDHGTLNVELDAAAAPKTVNSFVVLARYHYFDGLSCHRIVNGFMAQCGDPTGTGMGGPGYEFEDELPDYTDGLYPRGVVAMANSGANTNGSQFFVMVADYPLAPNYSVFGRVVDSDATLDALDAAGSPGGTPPSEPVTIQSVTITES